MFFFLPRSQMSNEPECFKNNKKKYSKYCIWFHRKEKERKSFITCPFPDTFDTLWTENDCNDYNLVVVTENVFKMDVPVAESH